MNVSHRRLRVIREIWYDMSGNIKVQVRLAIMKYKSRIPTSLPT